MISKQPGAFCAVQFLQFSANPGLLLRVGLPCWRLLGGFSKRCISDGSIGLFGLTLHKSMSLYGVILGLYWGYMGMMEKKMETTI